MPFCKRSIVEVDQNAKLSEIPDVGIWKTGTLSTNPRYFDLLCTGKVQINSSDYKLKLNVSATDKVPNFFTKNGAGEIVFAEPKPMCILKMPRGHYGTIIIRLKSVSTEQISAKDYVCLGVRENGIITDVIYGDNGYKYIDMTDDSKVELVPLISGTKLPNYTKAEIGTKVTFSNTNFDFGTVYRITIDDKQELEWSGPLEQTEGKRLTDISSGRWYNESSGVGIGPVKDKGVRLLAVNFNTGALASSIDGANWENEGNVNVDASSGWISGPVYGNGTWCISSVKYSRDEARTWLTSSMPLISGTCNLAFGHGVFMMVGGDKKVYVSVDANIWEEVGKVPYTSADGDGIRAVCYDNNNDRWMCISPFSGVVYTSKDGRGTWTPIVPDSGKGLLSSNVHWFVCCYAHSNFYTHSWKDNHEIMKSQDGKNWDLISHVDDSGSISFYNGKLYVFLADGIHYYTGTFK